MNTSELSPAAGGKDESRQILTTCPAPDSSRSCKHAGFLSFPFSVVALAVTLLIGGCKETIVQTIILGPNDLTNPAIQPRVIFTLPGNNAIGPLDLFSSGDNYNYPHFALRFNKLMNVLSFDPKAITVEGFDRPVRVDLYREFFPYPWLRKTPAIPGASSSNYDDVLAFIISDSLSYPRSIYRVGRSYSITILPGLEDINGNFTSERYQFTYQPEPYFRVTEIYPEEEPGGVSISSPISIVFNSHIDNTIFSSLQISPPLQGEWKLSASDSSAVQFQRFEFLPFNSSFTVSVHSGARDVYGNAINRETVSSFSVAPFKVTSTSPANGASDVEPDGAIDVGFSGLFDTSTVRQSFVVSPPTAGVFLQTFGNAYFTFQPTGGLIPHITYSVILTNGLHAYDGTPLSSSYTFSFTTALFRINYTSPSDGQFNVSRTQNLYFNCNARIDTGSVRAAFTIDPFIAGRFDLYDGSPVFTFVPATNLAANTLYAVTISTALRTKSGHNLLQTHAIKFKTGL